MNISSWARSISFALMLAASSTADAQGIIYTMPSQPIYYGPNPLHNEIDVNGDGTPDFYLDSDGGGGSRLSPLADNRVIAWPNPPPDLGSLLYALPQNYLIGSSLDSALQWYDRNTDQFGSVCVGDTKDLGTIGFFTGLESAYAGFDLYYDGASHYGWFHISNPLPLAAGQFVDWAYQSSPNTPILAGVVPEPSTISLCILGIIALFFRKGFRR